MLALLPVRLPPAAIDGAVVELQVDADGMLTAEVRIPAPQPEGQP